MLTYSRWVVMLFLTLLVPCTSATGQGINSLLWRITAPNGTVSHVYGTMHTTQEEAFKLRRPALEAFRDAELVAVEFIPGSEQELYGDTNFISEMKRLKHELMKPDTKESTDHKVLTESERNEIKDTLLSILKTLVPLICAAEQSSVHEVESKYGYVAAVNKVIRNIKNEKVDHLVSLVSILRDAIQRIANPHHVSAWENRKGALDGIISKLAIARGTKCIQLDEIKESGQLMTLVALEEGKKPMNEIRHPFDADRDMILYYAENIDSLHHMATQALGPKVATRLLEERNRSWINKLKPLLEGTSCFIAVGAGHLPGKYGMIQLLRSAGMKVEPVLGGERLDIRTFLASETVVGATGTAELDGEDQKLSELKNELAQSLKLGLQQKRETGIITIVFRFVYLTVPGNSRGLGVVIDFIDREDLKEEIEYSLRVALSTTELGGRLTADRMYNLTVQIEL
jgi:uncharacterized protein YbaP (TraB family)